jgi:hypothetical protein
LLRKPYLYILTIFFFCCEEAPDFGTIDSVDSPVVQIQTSKTTFTEFPIEIEWEGNTTAREFVYELQYVDDPSIPHSWSESDTTSETSMDFNNLDEGNYMFSVHGLYNQDNIGAVETLSFTVDVIPGPALRIYPLNQTVNTGDEIDVYLYFEEVPEESAVTGLHVEIQIDQNELEFISEYYDQGELLKQFGGQTIWPEPGYSDDNSTMIINGVAGSNGLYGTGPLIKFSLRVLTSGSRTTNINIISVDDSFLNMDGEPIEFGDPVSGSVTVE